MTVTFSVVGRSQITQETRVEKPKSSPLNPGEIMAKKLRKCNHPHVLSLQQEIDRLKSTQGAGFQTLMGVPEFRRLAELLATAQFRAEPSKGGSMALANGGGKLGPGESDGIAVLGNHIVTPGYSVPQRPDRAVLAQTLRLISECGSDVAGRLDSHAVKPKDTSVRCGLSKCRGRNRRQPFDSEYCAFCGRGFVEELESVG